MKIATAGTFELNGVSAARTYLDLSGCNELRDGSIGFAHWFAADFGELLIENFEFFRCEFNTADFSRATLINVMFRECMLIGAQMPMAENAKIVTYEACVFNAGVLPPWIYRKGLLP